MSKTNLSKKSKKRKRKKKKLQYWETLTAQQLEDEFNFWNRQQTTGLTVDELTPRVSVQDCDSLLLVTIDLAVDRDKVALLEKSKHKDNLQKLLKKLP